MHLPVKFRRRSKGAVLVATAVAVAALAAVGAAQAGAGAKPGPEALPATAGVVAPNESATPKPGVAPATAVAGFATKGLSGDVVPYVKGYTLVKDEFVNPAFSQSLGTVSCPTGTVALGGGVLGNALSFNQNINSSYPWVVGGVAKGWIGYVNNSFNDDYVFLVYAICGKKPTNYAVVTATFDNPPSSQTSGSVACPVGSTGVQMKPFSGGALGSSSTTDQNINSTLPVKSARSWRADMNNAGSVDHTFTVYAVCGLLSGWTVVKGAAVSNAPRTEAHAEVECTAGLTSVGGGIYSSSSNTAVDLNGSSPGDHLGEASPAWNGYENNPTTTVSASITPYVVCLA